MWLVLCDDLDASARWVYDGLRQRSVPAEFVPASVLSRAVRWGHRIGSEGASVEVVLPDGRCITSAAVRGTLNRMVGLWPAPDYVASPDSDYALQELLAMYVSLLQCLSAPVLNRPTSQGLSGRVRYTPDWLVLAARAGFATASYAVSSRGDDWCRDDDRLQITIPAAAKRHNVVVAAGRVFGDPLSARATAAACRLTMLAEVDLLGLRLATACDGGAWFEAADLYPDLRTAGGGLLDHLVGLAPGEPPT